MERKNPVFSGTKKDFGVMLEQITAESMTREATIEEIVAELRQLEADPLVRLADEEEALRSCLLEIRKILRAKQARGRRLEAMGITAELVQRYRKDYGDTDDWGC